jgi:hypothetical protein
LLLAGALLVSIGAGIPLLERWFKCRRPVSEACVWAKAYLPLSFGLWTIVGLVAAVALWFILSRRTRHQK